MEFNTERFSSVENGALSHYQQVSDETATNQANHQKDVLKRTTCPELGP
jgi:hypothetical protein